MRQQPLAPTLPNFQYFKFPIFQISNPVCPLINQDCVSHNLKTTKTQKCPIPKEITRFKPLANNY